MSGGQDFYHKLTGYGVRDAELPFVDYDAYKVTSLSGKDIYAGNNKLLGNSDAGYEIGDRVFLGSWQKYALGWPASMKEYSYHTIVDLQETERGLEIELYPRISDTHHLNSPYSERQIKLSRTNTVPITEIGIPRLYKLENHTTFFNANNLTILPNLLMGNAQEVRTMLHMKGTSLGVFRNLQFKPYDIENPGNNFANLQFLNEDTKTKVKSFTSVGNVFKYINVGSTDPNNKMVLENDKNINTVFISDLYNASVTNNTGVKRLTIKNSNLDQFNLHSEQVNFLGSNTIERLNSWYGHSVVNGFDNVEVTKKGKYSDHYTFKDSNLFSYDDNRLYIHNLREMRWVAKHLFQGKTVSLIDTNGNELVTGTIKKLEYYDRINDQSNFIYDILWNGSIPQNIDTWLRVNREITFNNSSLSNVEVTNNGYYLENYIFRDSNLFSYDHNRLSSHNMKEIEWVAKSLFPGKTVSLMDTNSNELVMNNLENPEDYYRQNNHFYFTDNILWNGFIPKDIDTWLKMSSELR